VKVWQAGSHLSEERGGKVGDWSWRQSRRRLATLVGLVLPYRARTVGAIVSLFAFTIVALVPPLLAKLAVDQGIKKGDLQTLAWIVLAFVAIGIATFGLSSLQTYLTGWVGERALADLRIQLFSHLQRLSLGYFERNRTGAIVSRITNDVEALDTLVTDGVTSLVQNLMLLVGTAVVLFFLDWRLALATLSVLPLMALATIWFRVRSNRAYRRVRERIGLVTATLAEDIAGMRVVQSYAREPRNQVSFRGINNLYREANYETIVLNGLYFPAVDFLASLATAIVLGYGGYLLLHDEVSVGTLLAFFLYLVNFFDPVQQLSQLYNTFLSATAALDKIIEVLDEEPEIVDAATALALPRIDGHVRFEGVRFGYGSLPEVLHGIDLDVPAGTSVALVGRTGAGKSTIAKLIARFYDPREGRITIDGHDIHDVQQGSLRRQLGVVPQEGFLFAGTVAENIAFARPDATRAEVEQAAAAVGADRWIQELENGYDTQLGERGFRLSLGQRQLVAFARALLADPRILILDEATSSVDIGTERVIEGALQRLLAGRTAFVIAHRLSTIQGADLIVVLADGQIVEKGTHEELMTRGGAYTSLYGDWAERVA
jgi:ABC-type multidrug transport system fused ATPase/permease subunit